MACFRNDVSVSAGMDKVSSLLSAELLHKRLVIKGRLDLPNFALSDVKGVDAWQCDLPSARWNTPKFPLVGPMHRGKARNLVSIGDHDLDREMDCEGISQYARELDEVHGTLDTSGGIIEDEIGRQNLVCCRHVTPCNNLVKETTGERVMCS
jgi:hypothetical protein